MNEALKTKIKSIERPQVDEWLRRHCEVPLRVLFAPAGYGKTSCLIRYLRSLDTIAAFVACEEGTTEKGLYEKIGDAVGLGIFTGREEFLHKVALLPPCQIAIDALDLASPDAQEAFSRLIFSIGENVRFIVSTSSRYALVAPRIFTQGLGVILDQRSLAFTASEGMQLCTQRSVRTTREEINDLIYTCEGWPALIAAIVRESASNETTIASALQTWRTGSLHAFRELVTDECARRQPRIKASFDRAASGSAVTNEDWRELKRAGMFAIEDGVGHRLIRPVAELFKGEAGGAAAAQSNSSEALLITFFGRFGVSIGGSPVQWKRRREMELFAHLLLQPNYSASRQQLMERFWPNADKHLAAQSLRTACSNIRKALGDVVGSANVSTYLTTSSQISIRADRAVRDIDGFESLATQGAQAYARNDLGQARTLFTASEKLYQNDVDAEGISDIEALSQRLSARYEEILKRLIEINSLGGPTREAQYYMDRLSRRTTRSKFA